MGGVSVLAGEIGRTIREPRGSLSQVLFCLWEVGSLQLVGLGRRREPRSTESSGGCQWKGCVTGETLWGDQGWGRSTDSQSWNLLISQAQRGKVMCPRRNSGWDFISGLPSSGFSPLPGCFL